MDDLDKNISRITNRIKNKASVKPSEPCPEDGRLASYLDGMLSGQEKIEVEKHLVVCDNCLDMTVLHRQMKREESEDALPAVPRAWIQKAAALQSEKQRIIPSGFFDMVLDFAKETIQIVENLGQLDVCFGPKPLPVRGGELRPGNSVELSKTFTYIKADISVDRTDRDHITIRVSAKSFDSGLPVDGIRMSLFNPNQEIASYVAEKGEACFEDIRFGMYTLKLKKLGREVGQVSLNLRRGW